MQLTNLQSEKWRTLFDYPGNNEPIRHQPVRSGSNSLTTSPGRITHGNARERTLHRHQGEKRTTAGGTISTDVAALAKL